MKSRLSETEKSNQKAAACGTLFLRLQPVFAVPFSFIKQMLSSMYCISPIKNFTLCFSGTVNDAASCMFPDSEIFTAVCLPTNLFRSGVIRTAVPSLQWRDRAGFSPASILAFLHPNAVSGRLCCEEKNMNRFFQFSFPSYHNFFFFTTPE